MECWCLTFLRFSSVCALGRNQLLFQIQKTQIRQRLIQFSFLQYSSTPTLQYSKNDYAR